MRQAIMQQMVSGQLPLAMAARIHELAREGKDIFAALIEADREVREAQARAQQEAAAQAPPAGGEVPLDAVPGLAAGPGAAAPGAPPAGLPPGAVPAQGSPASRLRELLAAGAQR